MAICIDLAGVITGLCAAVMALYDHQLATANWAGISACWALASLIRDMKEGK